MPFDLPIALAQAAPLQPIPISEHQIQQVVDFVIRRLEQVLVDGGISVEAVRAVLRQRGNSPALAAESAQQLQVGMSTGPCSPALPSWNALPTCPAPALCPALPCPALPYLGVLLCNSLKISFRMFRT